jgi:transcriptional regulator with XRE-family HTH domain
VASKLGSQDAASAESIAEMLDVVETALERLKSTYEQYFLGIQKQAPSHLHNDVERKLRDLTQVQIRNTALRYRLATTQQKFAAYNSYWRRTLRQIENGTYLRSLQKMGRKAAQSGADIPDEILAAMPRLMREQVVRDRERALAAAKRRKLEMPPEVDDADVAAVFEPSQLRRDLRAGAPLMLDEADADLDLDAFFAKVTAEDDKTDPEARPYEAPAAAPPPAAAPVAAPRSPAPVSAQTGPVPRVPPPAPGAAQTGPVPRVPVSAQTGPVPRVPVSAQTGPVPRVPVSAQTGPVPRVPPPAPGAAQTGPVPRVPVSAQTGPVPRVPPPAPGAPQTGPVPRVPPPAPGGAQTGPVPRVPPPAAPTRASGPIPQVPAVPKAAPSQATRPNPIAPGAAAARGTVPVESMSGPFPRPPAQRAETEPGPPPAPRPVAPSAGSRPRPAVEPPMRPPPGMSDADVNALYAKYVKAKEAVGERVEPGGYGKLLKTINSQAPKIMEQYKAKGVDFSVVVKDNQVIIRAKPKP